MRFITAPEIEIALDQKSLIEALRRAFRMGASARPYQAPLRNRFYVENVHAEPTILLNMPSWQVDGDRPAPDTAQPDPYRGRSRPRPCRPSRPRG